MFLMNKNLWSSLPKNAHIQHFIPVNYIWVVISSVIAALRAGAKTFRLVCEFLKCLVVEGGGRDCWGVVVYSGCLEHASGGSRPRGKVCATSKEKCINIKTCESHNSAGMCAVSGSLPCKSLSSVSYALPTLAWPCLYCSIITLLLVSCEIKPFSVCVCVLQLQECVRSDTRFVPHITYILADWVSMCWGAWGHRRWPLSVWRVVKSCLHAFDWAENAISDQLKALSACPRLFSAPCGFFKDGIYVWAESFRCLWLDAN